jgi:hypothetical protein
MKVIVGFIIVLLATVGVAAAQDCDPLLPCGPLPWSLPSLPDLASPTALPVANISPGMGTPTATPVSSGMILPSATPAFDVSGLNDGMGTLQAIANSTSIPINDLNGTPFSSGGALATLTANTSDAFGYVRGLNDISFGPLTPLVTMMFTAALLFLVFNVGNFLLPLVMALFGVFRKIVGLILDFLPF